MNPNPVQFGSSPLIPVAGTPEWSVWVRGEPAQSTLAALTGQTPYLVECAGAAGDVHTATVPQKVQPPRSTWVRIGANFPGSPARWSGNYPFFTEYGATIAGADYWRKEPVKPGEIFVHPAGSPARETPVAVPGDTNFRCRFREEIHAVSSATTKPTRTIYWTERSCNGPVVSVPGTIEAVNPVYSAHFPATVATEYLPPGSNPPDPGASAPPAKRTVWFRKASGLGQLHACNREGRILVEYLGATNPGAPDTFAAAATRGLRALGFNGLGNGGTPALQTTPEALPWTIRLNFISSFARERKQTYPTSGHTGFAEQCFPVFHPDFPFVAPDAAGGANKGLHRAGGAPWPELQAAARAVNRQVYPLIDFFSARHRPGGAKP